MGLNADVERISGEKLHDDWSMRLGENRSDQTLIHLAAILFHGGLFK